MSRIRKKVKLSFIVNNSTRKATFKKRKKGLIKKLNELTTLCGIDACAVIYSPFETVPEAWPSPVGVLEVLSRFRELSEMDQSRKMVNQESFIKQRIAKAKDQLDKVKKENREKEMTRVMFDCLTGNPLQGLTMLDLQDLVWVLDQHLTDIGRTDDFLTTPMTQSENQVLPALPPPLMEGGEEMMPGYGGQNMETVEGILAALPPPLMEGGEEMMPGYGGQNMETVEGIQGLQPWDPETMNSGQDLDQTMGFDFDDMILPFDDGNNSPIWSPFSP